VHKVVYKGLSDIREMTKKQLAEVGIGMEGDLVWDKTKSGHRPVVFIEDISDELLHIFKNEGTFTVTEVNDRGAEVGDEPVIQGAVLDDTGRVVRDGTTGQESVKPEGSGTSTTGSTGRGRSTGGGTAGGGGARGGGTTAGGSTDSPL